MKKAKRKSNLDEAKIQAQKDKGVTMLRRFGDDDAADKLEAESLESYALRKGIRVDTPRTRNAKKRNFRRSPVRPAGGMTTRRQLEAATKRMQRERIRLSKEQVADARKPNAKWRRITSKRKMKKHLKKDYFGRHRGRYDPAKDTTAAWFGLGRKPSKPPNRKERRKRNAFGLDRFFGRKSRVTSSDWNRAGEARRAQALRAAGVSKKLMPMYTDMSWRDMQSLEPSFITKVMSSLPARKNSRKRPRIRKNTSGTALAKKIRELMRDNGMSRSEATKAATRILRASHTKPGEYKRSRRHERRNPDALDRAGQTYAMFHGRGPKEVVKVNELTGGPKTVTALGDLLYFVVVPGDDDSAAYKVAWGSGDKRPFLASNTKATQLYIVGGNQDVDEMLRKMGVTSSAQDLLDLGEVREVEYYTQKDFDNFTPIRYFHHFGEEDKRNPRGRVRRPRLIYSRSNKKLMLAGGAYKIKKDGIIN
jgi:hypothetical protein